MYIGIFEYIWNGNMLALIVCIYHCWESEYITCVVEVCGIIYIMYDAKLVGGIGIEPMAPAV